ncbi:MAG: transcriptional regulator [Cyclobacteriaceae bacterium]|nr:transcriptional regulator [Cyclobacteriaceae bacterium]
MKELLSKLNKAFENKTRLGIMSALMVNDFLDFNALKDLLGVTDGNLASHLKTLETKKYIGFKKEFIDRKPNTRYFSTPEGRQAFKKHIEAIEQLLR